VHGELGVTRLRGVFRKNSTREPDPDNAGGGIAKIIKNPSPNRRGFPFFEHVTGSEG
jgi:hypothetical protein